MIVRCGRCQTEVQVSGPGEFSCPACGTRNSVRAPSQPQPQDPFGVPDLGGSAPPAEPPGDLTWIRCSECRRRFVVGEGIQQAPCPACGHEQDVSAAEPA